MTRRKVQPHAKHTTKARAPRPVFPFAVTLRAVQMIFEGNGRPALYVSTENHGGIPKVYRVPDACQITVKAPMPLPADRGPRVFLPAGSCATFQHGEARSVLALHSVRVCRELLEAMESHAHHLKAWQDARQVFKDGAA